MTESSLLVEKCGSVLYVTLNRPGRLNALNRHLIASLRDLFMGLYTRRDVRIVVLRGEGRAFCSGFDLKEAEDLTEVDVATNLDKQHSIADIVVAMRKCPQPIIAAINGPASGGGFALALASDVRIATPSARFNASFIKVGLSGCDIGLSYFLPRAVGSSVASELMLTGGFLEVDRALGLGLVSRVVEEQCLDTVVTGLAEDMLCASPLGLRLTKDALNHSLDSQGLEATIAMEDRNQILCIKDDNFKEGVNAFLEKRKPSFK